VCEHYHEYSHASREARAIGQRLLELTRSYEDYVARGRDELATAAMVARARRLLRAAYRLADATEGLEAAVLLRVMFEYGVTLRWLLLDPELNFVRWVVDGVKRVLSQDDELRGIELRRRADAGLDDPGPDDEPLGLLYPEVRTRYEAALEQRRLEIAGIENLEERLEPGRGTAAERAESVPSLKKRADSVGLGDIYALAYRFDSQAAAHPNALAAEQLLRLGEDGNEVVVGAAPERALPDPYAVGAALLAMMLEAGAEVIPDLEVRDMGDLSNELRRLEPFRVDEA
jgi:hypothetical protein